MSPVILTKYGLNSMTTVLLQGWLCGGGGNMFVQYVDIFHILVPPFRLVYI